MSKKLEWKKPIEILRSENDIKSITVLYKDDFSHYGVLYSVIEALVKNKWASRDEIKEAWKDILTAYK